MTTAQNQALGVAEAKAMNKATKEFTIVIMVDHERAARIYRQALTKIGLMMDDLSRAPSSSISGRSMRTCPRARRGRMTWPPATMQRSSRPSPSCVGT